MFELGSSDLIKLMQFIVSIAVQNIYFIKIFISLNLKIFRLKI